MTTEELRAENAEYLSALARFTGPKLAGQILDEYVGQIEASRAEHARRGDTDEVTWVTRLA